MIVKDVMSKQSYVLNEDDDIYQAAQFMKQERIRNIPVVDKENKLIGLVTLREIVDGLIKYSKKEVVHALGKESNDKLVRNIMISEVKAVGPNTPLKGVVEIMILNKFGIIPVVDNNRKLLGIVSEYELMKKMYELIELPKDFQRPDQESESFKLRDL